MTEVNDQAPVVGASEIEIAAAPEVVWDVLTAIDGWPSWNPQVKSASLEGEIAEGSVFRWKAGPGTITSTLRRVEPPRLIAWTGKTLGIDTFVRTKESYEGLVARLFRGPLQKTLDKALDEGLQHLKAEAERRANASS
jgi:hypothetical protein